MHEASNLLFPYSPFNVRHVSILRQVTNDLPLKSRVSTARLIPLIEVRVWMERKSIQLLIRAFNLDGKLGQGLDRIVLTDSYV